MPIERIKDSMSVNLGELCCFDNFSTSKVTLWGTEWMTPEHAYHAAKFTGVSVIQDYIEMAPSVYEARKIAFMYKHHMRSDWDEVKEEIKLSILEEINHPKRSLKADKRRIGEKNFCRICSKLWVKLRSSRKFS